MANLRAVTSGSQPSAASSSRRRASFIARTCTVARPEAVNPSIRAPRKKKWSAQRS
jgi:hypothetical protein